MKKTEPGFVVCLKNEGYAASLERHKIYRVLPDPQAEKDGDADLDESGEIISIERLVRADSVPDAVEASLLRTA